MGLQRDTLCNATQEFINTAPFPSNTIFPLFNGFIGTIERTTTRIFGIRQP